MYTAKIAATFAKILLPKGNVLKTTNSLVKYAPFSEILCASINFLNNQFVHWFHAAL